MVSPLARSRRRLTRVSALVAATATGLVLALAGPAAASGARTYLPAPGVAEGDSPIVYANGCHQGSGSVTPRACRFGPAGAAPTVALFGDSHAAHWFSAVRATSAAESWRLLTITKSGCPAADLAVTRYKGTARYPQCSTWRTNMFTAMRRGQYAPVDVLVMSSWSNHGVFASPRAGRLYGEARYQEWEKATQRTLSVVTRFAKQVVILRDSPDMPVSGPAFSTCMRVFATKAYRCGALASAALDGQIWAAERRAAALYPNVTTIDLSRPMCFGGYCPTVVNGIRVLKDDNHFTNTFVARVMTPRLRPGLLEAMTRATSPSPAPPPTDNPGVPTPDPSAPTPTPPTG